MKEKILYMLGAGASCKALPLAKTAFDDDDYTVKTEGLIDALSNIGLDKPTEFINDDINYPKLIEFQK